MKKLVSIVLLIAMLFGLTSCSLLLPSLGKNTDSETETNTETGDDSDTSTQTNT
jgi:predicted small lipoprotein YifL